MIPLLLLLSPLALAAAGPEHVVVYRETGRFGGWPANHGIWSWDNEILVGFSAAWYEPRDAGRHQMDGDKPEEPRLARSFDGGRTWTVEAPPSLLPPAQGGPTPVPLSQPIPFTAPGFAMTIRFLDIHQGASLLYWSQDRGKTWQGPFEFPTFGQQGVAARTDYVIDGPQAATVFLTASVEWQGRAPVRLPHHRRRPFLADARLDWTGTLRLRHHAVLTASRPQGIAHHGARQARPRPQLDRRLAIHR